MATPDHNAWGRLAGIVRDFFRADVGPLARRFAFGMLALLITLPSLNVVNSYVGRDFMTALVGRHVAQFYWQALLYVLVFAASTAAAATLSWLQGRLILLWRVWLTRRLVWKYLSDRTYLRLRNSSGVDNPDERMSDDVRVMTDGAMAFVVLLLNGAITAVAFAGVTWSITPWLFLVCVGYAFAGSALTVLLGRPLAGLNSAHLAREGDFRAALIHVRENAASAALVHAEPSLWKRLTKRMDSIAANTCSMLALNFRLGVFTGGYNYLVQIIPALVVAPMYIRGEAEFGVVTQAAMAFSQLVGALSLVITQFGAISSFAAVAMRLNDLGEAMESSAASNSDGPAVETQSGAIEVSGLTVDAAEGDRVLVRDLNVRIAAGDRLAVEGRNEPAQVALLRVLAGLWPNARGRIRRPPLSQIVFVPQNPYMIPGTLRDQFRPLGAVAEDDRDLLDALEAVGLAQQVKSFGGLDEERDWSHTLSAGEQQLVALARVLLARPQFAVLERVGRSVSKATLHAILERLSEEGTGLVVFIGQDERPDCCDRVLELGGDGAWTLRGARKRSRVESNGDGKLQHPESEPATGGQVD